MPEPARILFEQVRHEQEYRRFIEALELEDVVLVAHSMGGTEIARYFARQGGAKIPKVILVGTITPQSSMIGWSQPPFQRQTIIVG